MVRKLYNKSLGKVNSKLLSTRFVRLSKYRFTELSQDYTLINNRENRETE